MSKHNICRSLTIAVNKKNNKYEIEGIFYKGVLIIELWESIAAFSLISMEFSNKNVPKNQILKIEEISFQHVELRKQHFLKMSVLGEELFLNLIETKLIPAILNRVIARCDVLSRNSFYDLESDGIAERKIFKEFPITVEAL